MKKRQTSRNQMNSESSSDSASPSPDIHKENIPFDCSKTDVALNENIPDDPQPSTIAEADRVEKMQLAKLQDRKTRIRHNPPSQCPCCGRITR